MSKNKLVDEVEKFFEETSREELSRILDRLGRKKYAGTLPAIAFIEWADRQK
jgi:predicted house-cleaning noncanonical NTP pyrophosphatase (MazG superfamily)